MHSLRDLQLEVMDALLGDAPLRTVGRIAGPAALAGQRLAVYANNVEGNFHDALQSSFPVVRRLVGDGYFAQTAREYHRAQPSRSGDLTHAGEGFPDHLARAHGADAFGYLADVARFEWLVQESLLAAEHPPLELAALARVAPQHYGDLRFALHPTLRLFESRYPVLAIWEANADAEGAPPVIDLGSGGNRLAILRQRLQLRFLSLTPGEHGFLGALARGECLAEAIDHGAQADAAFDAAAALQRFAAATAVVAFSPQT